MRKIMKLPIWLVWMATMLVAFTFVDIGWIVTAFGRALFCTTVIVGAGLIYALNADFHFWKYEE